MHTACVSVLRAGSELRHEGRTTVDLDVEAVDKTGQSLVQTFHIQIVSENDAPTVSCVALPCPCLQQSLMALGAFVTTVAMVAGHRDGR